MKQDELNIEFKEFTEKLNLEEVVNIELESGFLLSFINHLLSKKPSVSDEEIERMASKYNLYRDEIRPFISGATAFRDTYYLPQSEVSDIAKLIEKYDNIHSCGECGEPRFSEFVHEFKQLNSLTPPYIGTK